MVLTTKWVGVWSRPCILSEYGVNYSECIKETSFSVGKRLDLLLPPANFVSVEIRNNISSNIHDKCHGCVLLRRR